MLNPVCMARSVWGWFLGLTRGLPRLDGCDFLEEEVIENARVSVLRCRMCGKYSINWSRK